MTIGEFDTWIKSILPIDTFKRSDDSLNGLQIGELGNKISKISFALDACQISIKESIDSKSDLLFVHHGLLWGQLDSIVGSFYKCVELAIKSCLALYAVHLPLDAVQNFGNNAIIAEMLNLKNCTSFCEIGYIGNLSHPLTTVEIAKKVFGFSQPLIWDHCDKIDRVAIVVGGGSKFTKQAVLKQAQCLITGEVLHQEFHFCQENHFSLIAGGHYESEMIGLKKFKTIVEKTFPTLSTHLIEIPTGV